MTVVATVSPESLRRTAAPSRAAATPKRWRVEDVEALFETPFMDLVYRDTAGRIDEHFDPNTVQLSTLLSIEDRRLRRGLRLLRAVLARSKPGSRPRS